MLSVEHCKHGGGGRRWLTGWQVPRDAMTDEAEKNAFFYFLFVKLMVAMNSHRMLFKNSNFVLILSKCGVLVVRLQ